MNAYVPTRSATHEFIVTLRKEAKETGATAMDYAKCLLEYLCINSAT